MRVAPHEAKSTLLEETKNDGEDLGDASQRRLPSPRAAAWPLKVETAAKDCSRGGSGALHREHCPGQLSGNKEGSGIMNLPCEDPEGHHARIGSGVQQTGGLHGDSQAMFVRSEADQGMAAAFMERTEDESAEKRRGEGGRSAVARALLTAARAGSLLCVMVALSLYRPERNEDGRHRTIDVTVGALSIFSLVTSLASFLLRPPLRPSLPAPIPPPLWARGLVALSSAAGTALLSPLPTSAAWPLRSFAVLQTVGVLSPLRRWADLDVLLSTLGASVPLLLQAFLLLAFVILLFAASATSLMPSALDRRCFSPTIAAFEPPHPSGPRGCGGVRSCPAEFPACVRLWDEGLPRDGPQTDPTESFGSIGLAALTSLRTVTMSGWMRAMHLALESASWIAPVWFVALVLCGAYLVVNIFVAVMEVQLSETKKKKKENERNSTAIGTGAEPKDNERNSTAIGTGTDAARAGSGHDVAGSITQLSLLRVEDAKREVARPHARDRRPHAETKDGDIAEKSVLDSRETNLSRLQRKLRSVCESRWFSAVGSGAILANVVVLAMRHGGMSVPLERALDDANLAFTCYFAVEMLLKIAAYGRRTFHDGWNTFDAVIVAASIIEVTALSSRVFSSLRALRALRALRLLRTLRHLHGLRVILDTVVSSIGIISAMALVLSVLTAAFTLSGFLLLGHYGRPEQTAAGFHDVPHAIRSMFQVLTMEDWEVVLSAYVGLAGWQVLPFFLLIITLGGQVLLSLMAAVMVQAFEEDQNQRASTASTAPSPPAPSRPTSPEQAPLNSGRKSTAPLGFGGAGPVTDTVSAPKSARHGHTHRPQRGSHTDSGQRTSPHPLPPLSVKPHALDCREASDQIPLSPHDGMGVDGDGAFSRGEKRGRKRAVVFSLPGDRTGRNRTGGEARMDTMVGCEVTKAGTSGVAGGDEKSGDKDWGLREGWMRSFLLGAEQEREEGQAMEDGEVGGATKMWEDEGTQLDGDGARSELKEAMPNGRDRLQGRGQGGDKKESGERKDWEVARVAETGERTHTSVLYAPSPALPKRLSSHIPPSFVASSLERRSSNNQSRRSAFGARLSVLGGRRNAIQMEPTEQTMGDGPRSGEGDGNSAQRRKLSVRFGEASTRVLFRDADQRAPANPGTAWAEMEGGIGQSPLQGEAKGEAGPEVAGVEDCRSHSVSVSRGGHRGSPLSWARRPLRSTGGYRASDGAVVAWGAEGESRSMFGVSDVALRSPKSESIQGGAKALRGQPSGLLETAGGMEQGQLRMAVGVATQGLPEKQSLERTHGVVQSTIPCEVVLRPRGTALAWFERCSGPADSAEMTPTGSADVGAKLCSGLDIDVRQALALALGRRAEGSMSLMTRGEALRVLCKLIVEHSWFETTVYVFILASCLAMTLESPSLPPSSTLAAALFVADLVFTAVFSLEALLKITAYSPKGYIADWRNCVDLSVIFATAVVLALERAAPAARALRFLRILRLLRLGRAVSHFRRLQLVMRSMALSVRAVSHVLLLLAVFFLIFAILGVELFAGRFGRCSDEAVATREACVGAMCVDGACEERRWYVPLFNFEDVASATLVLFMVSGQDGYTDALEDMMGAKGEGEAPEDGANPWAVLYFVGALFLLSFVLLGLFIGVTFYHFSQLKAASDLGSSDLTDKQREWIQMIGVVEDTEPLVVVPWPRNKVRQRALLASQSRLLQALVVFSIFGTFVLVSFESAGFYTSQMQGLYLAFSSVFVVELAVKVTGMGFRHYWQHRGNRVDMVISLLAAVDIVSEFFVGDRGDFNLHFVPLLRLVGALRLVRLVRMLSGLNALVSTLLASLPSLGTVGAALLLLIFAYSYAAMQLFGESDAVTAIDHTADFRTFPKAMLAMLRVATNDDWSHLMEAIVASTCGSAFRFRWAPCTVYPVVFLASFVLLVTVVLINMIPTVVIDMFQASFRRASCIVDPVAVEVFRVEWARRSPDGGTMSVWQLEDLLASLGAPLGIPPDASPDEIARFVAVLRIPQHKGRVHFRAVLFELVLRVSYARLPSATRQRLRKTHPRSMALQAKSEVAEGGDGEGQAVKEKRGASGRTTHALVSAQRLRSLARSRVAPSELESDQPASVRRVDAPMSGPVPSWHGGGAPSSTGDRSRGRMRSEFVIGDIGAGSGVMGAKRLASASNGLQ